MSIGQATYSHEMTRARMSDNEMKSERQEPGPAENRWLHAWREHRQELGVWLFAVTFYFLFVKGSEPSRYTTIMLVLIFIIPPLFLVRFFWTANRSEPHCLSKGTEHRKDDERQGDEE